MKTYSDRPGKYSTKCADGGIETSPVELMVAYGKPPTWIKKVGVFSTISNIVS